MSECHFDDENIVHYLSRILEEVQHLAHVLRCTGFVNAQGNFCNISPGQLGLRQKKIRLIGSCPCGMALCWKDFDSDDQGGSLLCSHCNKETEVHFVNKKSDSPKKFSRFICPKKCDKPSEIIFTDCDAVKRRFFACENCDAEMILDGEVEEG